MPTYTFSGGLTEARGQFEQYTEWISKESLSIEHDDKWVRDAVDNLCNSWTAYAVTQGPDSDDGNHMPYNYNAPQKSLNKLARLLAGD